MSCVACNPLRGRALSRLVLALLLGVSAVSAPASAAAAGQDRVGSPGLTIDEAINVAKGCILKNNVRVVGSFIESARLDRNSQGDRGPYWRVTWARAREVKGGQIFVTVFANRRCEITYGE
jgi:hypothetical protein